MRRFGGGLFSSCSQGVVMMMLVISEYSIVVAVFLHLGTDP